MPIDDKTPRVTAALNAYLPPDSLITVRGPIADDAAAILAARRDALADMMPPLSPAELVMLTDMQMRSQDLTYASWDDLVTLALLRDGRTVGRLILRWPAADAAGPVHGVDLAIGRADRGGGIGTALVRALVATAAAEGRGMTLNVSILNPAQRLYERQGFRRTGNADGPFIFMERPAGPPADVTG